MLFTIKRFGFILGLALLVSGCSEVHTEYAYGLQLSTQGASFDAQGGARTIEVAAFPESEPWEVVEVQDVAWFDYAVDSDGITITAEPNESEFSRSSTLEIVSPAGHFDPFTLRISQEATMKISFSTSAASEYTFDSEGGSYTFGVESNYGWEVLTESEWIRVEMEPESRRATITAERNRSDKVRSGEVRIVSGEGQQRAEQVLLVEQTTRAENPYYQLVGKWEITASTWFYSPNGSLNSLEYAPNPADYYLIFDLDEGEYRKSYMMRNFLYPGTELEVRYDEATGDIILPLGWTVLSYDVFFYLTLMSTNSFSYASMELTVRPNSDFTTLTPQLPSVEGFKYVGFGLWTYDEDGNKIALGSNYRPTMFPMGNIVFRKQQ